MCLLLVLWCLCLEIELGVATKLFTVYWNTTNPVFRIDNTDHIYDVNRGNIPFQYDQVNIICPQYPEGYTGDLERYIIYNVSKEEYESCRITNPNPRVIAVCDKPYKLMYFTITFRSFTPQPGGLEFRPGQDYYFISTSSPEDLHRRIGGSCKTHHMKVVFKVCCDNQSTHQTEEMVPIEEEGTEYEVVSPQPETSSSSDVGISHTSLSTVVVTSQATTTTVPVKTTDRNFYKTIPSQDKSENTKKTDTGWKHPNEAAVVSSGVTIASDHILLHVGLSALLMLLSVPR